MERTKLATFGGQRLNAKFKQLFTAAGAPLRGGERREAPLSSEVSLSLGITQWRARKATPLGGSRRRPSPQLSLKSRCVYANSPRLTLIGDVSDTRALEARAHAGTHVAGTDSHLLN